MRRLARAAPRGARRRGEVDGALGALGVRGPGLVVDAPHAVGGDDEELVLGPEGEGLHVGRVRDARGAPLGAVPKMYTSPPPPSSAASAALRELKSRERRDGKAWRGGMDPRAAEGLGVPLLDVAQPSSSAAAPQQPAADAASRRGEGGGGGGLLGFIFGGGGGQASSERQSESESGAGSLHEHDSRMKVPGVRQGPTLWSFSSAAMKPEERGELLREATISSDVHPVVSAQGVASARMGEIARLRLKSPRHDDGVTNARPESSRLARLSALPGDLLGWKPRGGAQLTEEQLSGLLAASLPASQQQQQEASSPASRRGPGLAEVSGYFRTRGQRDPGTSAQPSPTRGAARSSPSPKLGAITVKGNESFLRGPPRAAPRAAARLEGADDAEKQPDIRTNFESIRQEQARRWAALNGGEGGGDDNAPPSPGLQGGGGGGGGGGGVRRSPGALRSGGGSGGGGGGGGGGDARERFTDLEGLLRSEGLKLRVIDIFRMLDKDGDGTVTRDEFCKRMVQLGAGYVLSDQVANLFEEIDEDGSGEINYLELNRRLRRGNAITLARELRDGALGEIELRPNAVRSASPSAALPLPDEPSRSPVRGGTESRSPARGGTEML